MSPNEANESAMALRGLFPSLTPEQAKFWANEFERFNPFDAAEACQQHFRANADGFVKPAGLFELLYAKQRKRDVAGAERRRLQESEIEQERQRIREACDRLSDEEFQVAARECVARLPEPSQRFFNTGVLSRNSVVLSALVAKSLQVWTRRSIG